MSTAPPNVFGPFRVLHQVGAGALGPVFRAYDPDRDRLVAVKLFQLDLAPDRVHRLVAGLETILAAGLTHHAIARPIAAGIEGVDAYLALEYVAAESLDIVVREQGPAPAADAVRIAAQLAEALDIAAEAGIVHGALHPRDLLLSPDELRLTGLGVAGALEAIGAVAPIRRPYAAPERAAGAAWNRSADIFSLAALVHELLWGRRIAATGPEAAESLTEIAGGDLPELQSVFARALAGNPDERFATAAEFAGALASCFGHQAPATSHHVIEVIEPRLPLEDDIARAPAFAFDVEPPLDPVVERFSEIDVTPESPISQRSAGDSVAHEWGASSGGPIRLEPDPTGDGDTGDGTSHPPLVAGHQSRSPLWPVGMALVAGAVIGSGVGYGVGTRMLPSLPSPTASASDASPSRVRLQPDSSATADPSSTVRLKPDTTTTNATTTAPTAAAATSPDAATASGAAATPVVAQTGRLVVRSSPTGARVFIDGKDVGRTPVTVRELARGSHRVRLTHDGYTSTERRVSITPEQLSRTMTVTLARPAGQRAR